MSVDKVLSDLRYENYVLKKQLDEAIRVISKLTEEEVVLSAAVDEVASILDPDLWTKAINEAQRHGVSDVFAYLRAYLETFGIELLKIYSDRGRRNCMTVEIQAHLKRDPQMIVRAVFEFPELGDAFLLTLESHVDYDAMRGFY